MASLVMARAIAVWLLRHTKLVPAQIARSCGLHELEISALRAGHLTGEDPTLSGQLAREEIKRCEADPNATLNFIDPMQSLGKKGRTERKYTSLAYRQERPRGILWLLQNHPELSKNKIAQLLATTPKTIQDLKDKTHSLSQTLKPANPVLLGLCSESELQEALHKAARRRAALETTEKVTA